MKLSIIIITFNEERIIEKTLKSVHNIADEIIIVDSFSSDKTEIICKKFQKVKFIKRRFEGFGNQKNFALDLSKGEWILFLDADEVIDETLAKSIIKTIIKKASEFDVYSIEFNNIFLGKIVKYGGWGNTWRERLFKKNAGKFSDDIVHESYKTAKRIGKLRGKINHYTYIDIQHHMEKTNRYTTLMAEKLFVNGKRSGIFKIIYKPFYQFVKSYFLKLGILDGFVGYYAAKTSAFYTFLKYSKLYEIQHKK